MKEHILYGLAGLTMGVIVSCIGFTSFEEIHNMFTLRDFRLLGAFIGAIAILSVSFAIISRWQHIPKKKFNKGTIPGSILFGMGWAITGSSPSIALV